MTKSDRTKKELEIFWSFATHCPGINRLILKKY